MPEAEPVAPAAASEGRGVDAAWTLASLAAGHFAVDCCAGIFPVFKTLAGLDIAKAGLIATIGSMVGNGLQLAFGTIADRGWRRRLIITGVAVAGSVTFTPWAVGSYTIMAGLVLATQIGSAGFHPSATGAAAMLSRRRTGFMIALFLAGGYAGYSFSQVLFSAVYRLDPAWTPVIAFGPLGVAAALALTLGREIQPQRVREVERKALVARLRPVAPLFAVQTLAGAVNVSLVFLLPDLLVSRGAPAWLVEGGGHFALVAGGCLALLPSGYASDHWEASRVLVAANLASGALLALLLVRGGASSLDLVLVTGIGAANGMNNVVAIAHGNRLMPGQASGASALLMGLPWCVAALGPVVAGLLADPTRGGSPASALGWFLLLFPLAIAAAFFVRPPRDEPVTHRGAY